MRGPSSALRYACIMPMSCMFSCVGEVTRVCETCIFPCICVLLSARLCSCFVLPHSAQGHVLSRKRKRAEKPETKVLWLIWTIDFTLTVDLPLIHGHTSADVRGTVSILSHTETYRKLHYAYTLHRRLTLMDSALPWRKYNSKSMR